MIKCPKCVLKFASKKRLEKHFNKAHPEKKGYEETNPGWREPVGV